MPQHRRSSRMKKRWWLGGLVLVVAGVAASLVLGGHVDPVALWAKIGKGKDKKPEVTLEFVASEVVQPTQRAAAAHDRVLGPAGGAAVGHLAQQGRRHLDEAQRGRGQPRQGRAGGGHASTPPRSPAAWPSAARCSNRRRRWRRRPNAPTRTNQQLAEQKFISGDRAGELACRAVDRAGAVECGAARRWPRWVRRSARTRWWRRSRASSPSAMRCRARS